MKQPRESIDAFVKFAKEKEELELSLREQLKEMEKNLSNALKIDDGVYTLRLFEWRDDTVHCFQVAAEVPVRVVDIIVLKSYEHGVFLAPKLVPAKLTSAGKVRKTQLHYNEFLHWELRRGDEVILSFESSDQVIIDGTYTEADLARIRSRSHY
jgi:hypothetical protein